MPPAGRGRWRCPRTLGRPVGGNRVPRAGQMRSIGRSARVKNWKDASSIGAAATASPAPAKRAPHVGNPRVWGWAGTMDEVFVPAPPARLDSPCTHAPARCGLPWMAGPYRQIGPPASSRHAHRRRRCRAPVKGVGRLRRDVIVGWRFRCLPPDAVVPCPEPRTPIAGWEPRLRGSFRRPAYALPALASEAAAHFLCFTSQHMHKTHFR